MDKKMIVFLFLILLGLVSLEHWSKSREQKRIGGERFTPRHPSCLQRLMTLLV